MNQVDNMVEFAEYLSRTYRPYAGFRLSFRLDASGNWPTSAQSQTPREADLALVNHLRSISDVIVTGGNTARAEDYRGSRHAPIFVVSNQLTTLDLSLFQTSSTTTKPALLATSNEKILASSAATAALSPESSVEPQILRADIQRLMQEHGFNNALLETGPSLTRLLAPLVGEICLTNPEDVELNSQLERLGFSGLSLLSDLRFGEERFTRWAVAS